ncbi:Transcriptional corepressor SEUSS [Nymphaea thermarum]|nr:Transcriptional corepressor SEUSS [Nymphaea thermarum]
MVPSGPPTPVGGAQTVNASALLRSNSGLLGGQGGSLPAQPAFPSLVSPRSPYGNMNLAGNLSNASSLLIGGGSSGIGVNQPLNGGNGPLPGGSNPGLSASGNIQRGGIGMTAESDILSGISSGLGFNPSPLSITSSNASGVISPGINGSLMGVGGSHFPNSSNQLPQEPNHSQRLEMQNFHHGQQVPDSSTNMQIQSPHMLGVRGLQQFSAQNSIGLGASGQQQHLQTLRALANDQNGPQTLASSRGLLPDNSIEFWRKFVSEFFAPHAKKRWCVSLYGNGRQTTGDVWHCEICNIKPGRGFETTVEVLPRLCKIKYDSGTLEELLFVDMPREYQTPSGHIVLDYGKAIQESVFDQLRVVRDGQLRVVFNMDLKICSWEFCARRHEEFIPRKLILSQVSQLGAVAHKYQASTQNGSSNLSPQELPNTCNMFVETARRLVKAMEVPLVNDLGYTKRYVRCLQISEVVNSMKDLIDYSRETGTGPMASLINFPRRTTGSGGTSNGQQQHQEQSRSQNGEDSVPAVQHVAQGNGAVGLTNSLNTSPTSTVTAGSTIGGLVHQNNANGRPENPLNNGSTAFGTAVQISSAGSSTSLQPSHPNPSSPFPSTSAPPNSLAQSSIPPAAHSSSANSPANIAPPQPSHSGDVDPDDSQSSVQQIIEEIMMSSQLNNGGNMVGHSPLGNEMKSLNPINMQAGNTSLKGANCLVGNGISSGMGVSNVGFGSVGGINPISAATVSGMRPTASDSSLPALNGRISMPSLSQQVPGLNSPQDMGNRMLNGLGSVNNFSSLQFDWKPSP